MLSNFQHFGTDLPGVMEKLPKEWALRVLMTQSPRAATSQPENHPPFQPTHTFRSEQAHWDVELSYYTTAAFEDQKDAYHLGNTGAAQARTGRSSTSLTAPFRCQFIAATPALSEPRRHAVSIMSS